MSSNHNFPLGDLVPFAHVFVGDLVSFFYCFRASFPLREAEIIGKTNAGDLSHRQVLIGEQSIGAGDPTP